MAPGDDRRRRAPAAVGVPLVLAVGLLVVLGAATGSRWAIADRFGLFDGAPSYEARTPPPLPSGRPSPPTDHLGGSDVGSLVVPVLWAALALGVLALAFWVWRVLPRPATGSRAAAPTGGPATGLVDVPHAPTLQHGVDQAQQLLDAVTDPTDAVLAAWVALEDAAARSGVPRQPADTPTELTTRVLAATEADAAAVTTLLGLYHRARFSAGGVGPDAVVEARRCLGVLARSWSRFSARTVPPA